jgi:hypothetical protein
VKTTLGADEREGVWRRTGRRWPFYAWDGDEWRCYPIDPRRGPVHLVSVSAANQVNGEIHSDTGFWEVPSER